MKQTKAYASQYLDQSYRGGIRGRNYVLNEPAKICRPKAGTYPWTATRMSQKAAGGGASQPIRQLMGPAY